MMRCAHYIVCGVLCLPWWAFCLRSTFAALAKCDSAPLTRQAASAHLPTVESRRAKAAVAVEGPHNAHVAHTPAHLPMDGTSFGPARSYQAPRSDDGHNDIGEAEHKVRPLSPSVKNFTSWIVTPGSRHSS